VTPEQDSIPDSKDYAPKAKDSETNAVHPVPQDNKTTTPESLKRILPGEPWQFFLAYKFFSLFSII
jgi:hypothetical protein